MAVSLSAIPPINAFAFNVVVEVMVNVPENTALLDVGSVPFVVNLIVAPGVAHDKLTDIDELNV